MRIWLVNPPVIRERTGRAGSIVQSLFFNSPPLGLAHIAAVLEQDGHQVWITDCPVELMSVDELADEARRIEPDLVGITSTTSFFDRAVASAVAVRGALPHVSLCIGGPHFNANPELLLQHAQFDFGVRGEGELTLSEVVGRIDRGQEYGEVPGVVTVQDDQLHLAPPRALIPDLDVLPMPSRHLLPLKRYRPMPNDQTELPKTSMVSSRGCPFQCIFCDKATYGASYRSFSPARVVEEMHVLEDREFSDRGATTVLTERVLSEMESSDQLGKAG